MAGGTVFFRHRDGHRCQHARPGLHPCPGGAWAYVVDVGAGPKRRQKKHGGFVTKLEAEKAVQALRASIESGEHFEPSRERPEPWVLTYTDAVSFALMEMARCRTAEAFDGDFERAGFERW